MRVLAALILAVAAGAQQLPPAFDAASVKLNRSAPNFNGGGGIKPGGGVSMRNVTVRMLVELAYGASDYQLFGGPAWMGATGYDVDAKPAAAVDMKTARLMLQTLLTERFGLKLHRESGTVNGFHLTVDRGGSKLKPSQAAGVGFRIMVDKFQGSGDMPELVSALSGALRAPVDDRTGIEGNYDLDLKWTSDPAAEPALSIFTAIRQQLGLSLETAKVAIDKLVIDRVERPTEN